MNSRNWKRAGLGAFALLASAGYAHASNDRCDPKTNHIIRCTFKNCTIGWECVDTGRTCKWHWSPTDKSDNSVESPEPGFEQDDLSAPMIAEELETRDLVAFCH